MNGNHNEASRNDIRLFWSGQVVGVSKKCEFMLNRSNASSAICECAKLLLGIGID